MGKIKIFGFMGIPVYLDLFFLLLLPIVGFNFNLFIYVFISILVHEMAHVYVAQKLGWRTYEIFISLLHGSASIQSNLPPTDNIKITAAGPISNLLLFLFSSAFGIYDLATINLFLFLFNILPIIPMDGGIIVKEFLGKSLGRESGYKIAHYISIFSCVLLLIYSILNSFILTSIFSIIFIYQSLKELKLL